MKRPRWGTKSTEFSKISNEILDKAIKNRLECIKRAIYKHIICDPNPITYKDLESNDTKGDVMKEINSNIFGHINLLEEDDTELQELEDLIEKYPVNAFAIINKALNITGLCCTIGVVPRKSK